MSSWLQDLLRSSGGRVLLAFLLVVLLGGLVGGFILAAKDAKGFALNLIAELVGTAFSFLVALLLVDWYVEHRKKMEWRKIGEMTLRAIAVHICEIGGALFLHYGEIGYDTMQPIFSGHLNPPNERTLKALGALVEALANYRQPLAEGRKRSTSDLAVDYYESVKWDLEQIRNVLLPRVLAGPRDQELVELLVRFDQEYREFEHAIIAHKQAGTQSVFPHRVVALIEAARDCYGAIAVRFAEFSKTRNQTS